MKQGSTLFLKFVILLIGAIALTFLIWFPQTEGRATNLDLISIYRDPFVIYSFIASVPFFVALHQAFKLLGFIEQNKVFSPVSVAALRTIKRCVLAFIGFVVVAVAVIALFGADDDRAGPIALGFYTSFAASVFATGVAVAERLLQRAVEMKSENDLTV